MAMELFDFEKIAAYQKARTYFSTINELIHKSSISPNMRDQLERAALSIPLNIAEGSGRISLKERRHFFTIARGSLYESWAILDIMNRRGNAVKTEEYQELYALAIEISKLLYAMIRNLNQRLQDLSL
ncbi:MAG: four helix bundle protein [Flavobacteriales bacterium]|nr:four helix bundle protein [Bacteroidota bacterium]MCB9239534.1 four helix bundle protein [Flavobacteriales bacterium]